MCGGVGKTFRYLPQFLVVVVLRGLDKLQLCLQFGNVREEISLNDLCQCLCACVCECVCVCVCVATGGGGGGGYDDLFNPEYKGLT